jgi:hypothetical protein
MRWKISSGEGIDVLIPKSKRARRRKKMDILMHKFKK